MLHLVNMDPGDPPYQLAAPTLKHVDERQHARHGPGEASAVTARGVRA